MKVPKNFTHIMHKWFCKYIRKTDIVEHRKWKIWEQPLKTLFFPDMCYAGKCFWFQCDKGWNSNSKRLSWFEMASNNMTFEMILTNECLSAQWTAMRSFPHVNQNVFFIIRWYISHINAVRTLKFVMHIVISLVVWTCRMKINRNFNKWTWNNRKKKCFQGYFASMPSYKWCELKNINKKI